MLLLVHSRLSRRMVKRLRVPLKTVMETDVDESSLARCRP